MKNKKNKSGIPPTPTLSPKHWGRGQGEGDFQIKRKTGIRQTNLPPGFVSLKSWFERSGLALQEDHYRLLWKYHTMIREKNKEYDLTRIYQFDRMVLKHYIDCILVAKLLHWELPSPLLDIGTGAGFPGIPLKIVSPETAIILSEGRHKRIRFLKEAVEVLGLKGIEIYEGKIYASFHQKVKGVITRAVESMPKTLARVKRCLLPEGKVIFMKGPHCEKELEDAFDASGGEYALDIDLAYNLPFSPYQRRLLVFRKLATGQDV